MLPSEIGSFVGRDRYLRLLRDELRRCKLVSLCGPPGVGKTRLATVFAEIEGAEYPGGVTFIDASDAAGSARELAESLREASALLILDRCDALDDVTRSSLAKMFDAVEGLRVVATSRSAPVRSSSPVVILPPLSLPDDTACSVAAWVASAEAVELFVDRARSADARFELDDDNCELVARLCRRLDGIPSAIEAAAAWMRTLSVKEILERMDRDPGLVGRRASSSVTLEELESVADDYFESCGLEERELWMRLSVFDGSFCIDAAEAVCAESGLTQAATLEVLASLIDRSVVTADVGVPESRFRLLWPMKARGMQALRHSTHGEEAHEAHARWYTQFLRSGATNWLGPDQRSWAMRIRAEHSNLVAAICLWAAEPRTVDRGLAMASDLWLHWLTSGQVSEGRAVLDRVLAAPAADRSSPMRARALLTSAYIRILQHRDADAEALIMAARDMTPSDAPLETAFASHVEGMLDVSRGRVASAFTGLEQAIVEYSELSGERAEVLSLDALGLATFLAASRGEEEAVRAYELRGLVISGQWQDRLLRAYIDYSAAVELFVRGEIGRAGERARRTISEADDELLLAHCVELLAWCAVQERHAERAAVLLGAADRKWQQIGGRLSGFEGTLPFRDDACRSTRSTLGRKAFESAYASGSSLRTPEVHQYALVEKSADARDENPLTRREREVAGLVARGLTNRKIAEALIISQRTVESHLDHILTKLDLANRVQLATWVAAGENSSE